MPEHERTLEAPALGPAALTLREYEQLNLAAGHENAGFLSRTHGYLPSEPPLERLDPHFASWDQAARELPTLYREVRVRSRLFDLPVLDASSTTLPDAQLLRAGALLGMLAHAYWHSDCRSVSSLPEAVGAPWAQVRARLGRTQPVLSYIDLIVYNWKYQQPNRLGPRTVEQLELLFPTIGNQEEQVFYLTQLEILARTAQIVPLTAAAQTAGLQGDDPGLMRALEGVGQCLRHVRLTALRKIDPRTLSKTYVDPVIWAKTVAPFAVPFARDMQGPSGTSSPLFSTLDVFFGRRRYASALGREMVSIRANYPAAWRAFLTALGEPAVSDLVAQRQSPALHELWRKVRAEYVGPDGFLERHRMKVYGYLELAFKVGRGLTIGGFSGPFSERTWDAVDAALRESLAERGV